MHTPIRTCKRVILAGTLAAVASASGVAHAQTELDFWDMIWGPPEYIETAEAIVAKFNETHPDIQVKYRSVPWSNWYQTFVSAVSAGSAPDLSTGASMQAVQLYSMGAIRPLDDMVARMEADGSLGDFAPGTVETLHFDDHYVALPWGIDIRVWFYRPSLLEAAGVEVPTTWDEFRAAAKALTGDGKYGVAAAGDTGGGHYIMAAMMNNDGGFFDADGKLVLDSNERDLEALQWLSDMVADGSIDPASAGYSSDDKQAAFLRGNAAFILDNPGMYKEGSPEVTEDIAILPPLTGPHGDVGTVFWVNNIMMYEQTEHPAETEVFLQWWSENQEPLWTEGHAGQIPARQSFVENAAGGDERYLQIVEQYIPIAKGMNEAVPGIFPALNEFEGDGVLQTLSQRIFQGAEVSDALSQVVPRMNEILE